MNVNEEDFAGSDAWISEQFFTQLKDFNSEYRERFASNDFIMSDPIIDGELAMNIHDDLQTARLGPCETVFTRNVPVERYDIKSEMLDIEPPLFPFEPAVCGVSLEFPSQAIDLSTTAQLAQTPTVNIVGEMVGAGVGHNIIPQFDSLEEELKLLRFLEEQPRTTFIEPLVYLPSQLPLYAACGIIKCTNCNFLFDAVTFQNHVCVYEVTQSAEQPLELSTPVACPAVLPAQLPSPPVSSTPVATTHPVAVKPIKEELLPAEPACIRLLKENQIRIRRFLKEEIKYDVYSASSTNSNAKNNSNSTNISHNDYPSTDILNSSSTSTASGTGSSKKQEGPHECTLCEKKFVHASGLLRHMEKHAMDLIPTSNSTTGGKSTASQGSSSLHNVKGLRVVIKCTLCGRIFFEQNSAFIHLCSHFPNSWMDEKEMDNCADIPYESYMDDALNFLKLEANGGSSCITHNAVTNYQDQKTPVFLKMVILTCILQCEFCDFVFSDVSYLFVHAACHIPERRFECFSCDIYMRTSKEICSHWQAECVFMRENTKVNQAITQRYFVCNVCENKFHSLDLLHEHRYISYHFFPRLNKRLGILQLPCEYCELVSENAQDCVNHYEDKHYRKYRRDKDGTANACRTRQYLCDICGKSYTQSSHLWQHLRFHQGVKPFACKEPGCTRKFTIRPDLNDHIRKCHTGERPYHCLVCGKRFLTGSVFYQHRLIHRGERRYECEECGKRFYRADALKNHQRIHTGEKPFGCLFCTKNFRQRGDRDKHMKARHSHLDANARLMMQVQKMQLEAAAAVAAAQDGTQQHPALTMATPNSTASASFSYVHPPPINKENIAPSSSVSGTLYGTYQGENDGVNNNDNDIVMIGNVAFPKTMIESLILDVDEESVLKTMQQNAM